MNKLTATIINSLSVIGSELILQATLTDDETAYLADVGIDILLEDGRTVARKVRDSRDFFRPEEFMCPCCGKGGVNSKVHKALNQARAIAGVPFILNSAYRCKKHNDKVGGNPDSAHTRRYAVDIRCQDSSTRFKIVGALLHAGFNRVGISDTFVHADMDPNKPSEVIWLY